MIETLNSGPKSQDILPKRFYSMSGRPSTMSGGVNLAPNRNDIVFIHFCTGPIPPCAAAKKKERRVYPLEPVACRVHGMRRSRGIPEKGVASVAPLPG